VLSIETARSLYFLVLVCFLAFTVSHVALVFTTGLLNNLNHIYSARNDDGWIGFTVFAASMVVVSSVRSRRDHSRCAHVADSGGVSPMS